MPGNTAASIVIVRVYLDAGGRDVFVAQNAAQYFSDYPLVPRYSFYPGHYFLDLAEGDNILY